MTRPTYWQQIGQITINDAALFMADIADPRAHEELISQSEPHYDHFAHTLMDECSQNIVLIRDAIKTGIIRVTEEIEPSSQTSYADSKISKADFVQWCNANGRFDITKLLSRTPPEPASRTTTRSIEDVRTRRLGVLQRHIELKAKGVKNPTEQLAKELEVTPGRVRQLLQKAKKPTAAPPNTIVAQLNAIASKSK
jgi:hypothetical protein